MIKRNKTQQFDLLTAILDWWRHKMNVIVVILRQKLKHKKARGIMYVINLIYRKIAERQ